MTALLLADHDNGALSPATARAVAALTALGGPIHVLVIGHAIDAVASAAAAIAGVASVLAIDDPALAQPDAAALVSVIAPLVPDYTHVAAISAAAGRDALPRLAARLGVSPITDVIAIHDARRFDRPIYAGNAIETVRAGEGPVLLTIRASAFSPAPGGGTATLTALPAHPAESLAKFLVEHRTQSDIPDLATAQVVVAGGVSLGSSHNFEMVETLARLLGGAVGATRAAVDAGYAPNDWQVGQTGKVIAPDLYIAIGISGALQHLAGIQGAKTIIAINLDPEAPLVKIADHRFIGDLFDIVPALIAALEARLRP